jgi:hypothetical protein
VQADQDIGLGERQPARILAWPAVWIYQLERRRARQQPLGLHHYPLQRAISRECLLWEQIF